MSQNTQTHHLITALRQTFCHTAVADVLWSDGGPQFTSSLFIYQLCSTVMLHAPTSSPRYLQSNGKIEATMKSMKKLLTASWDHRHLNGDKLCCAMLQYHNTPSCKDGLSMAKNVWTPHPGYTVAHHRSFAPVWQKSIQEAEQQTTETIKDAKTSYPPIT